jgi:integrase
MGWSLATSPTALWGRAFRLRDLRHYRATQLIAAGVSVTTVSKRLGHTSMSVTLDANGHWLPEQDREAADVMARLHVTDHYPSVLLNPDFL